MKPAIVKPAPRTLTPEIEAEMRAYVALCLRIHAKADKKGKETNGR